MNVQFRVGVNGGKYSKVFETMLGDTLSEYLDDFAAGESKKLSILLEVPENINIQSLAMTITHGGGTLTKSLQ